MNKKLQRANKIIEILKEKNGASVKELASTLGVSEMTIRRDLNILKSNNIVSNVYGATIYNPLNNIDKLNTNYDITDETVKRENEKMKIGKAAAKLIKDDDIIIIDSGTTTEKLAQNINDNIKLTALFYSVNILMALKNKKNIELIFSGGYFHENTQMFESPEGISLIENMRATKVFVSAAGIHEDLGVTCSNNYEVATKRTIINSSVEKILLVDSTKFDCVKPSYFSDLQEFNIIVTDQGIPNKWKELLESMDIKIIIA